MTEFELPPSGGNVQQLTSYLYRLCERLTVVIEELSAQVDAQRARLEGENVSFRNLSAGSGDAQLTERGELLCKSAQTNALRVFKKADIESLECAAAKLTQLQTETLESTALSSQGADVDELEALNAQLHSLASASAQITELDAGRLRCSTALSFPNGVTFNATGGIELTSLWQAPSSAGYKGTSDVITGVSGTEKFRLYGVKFCASGDASEGDILVPCLKVGSYLRGVGGYAAENNMYIFSCSLQLSGTRVTVAAAKVYNPQSGNYNNRKICRIYGIL